MIDSATETGTRNANQRVTTARIAHNQRTTRIAQTSVLMAIRMASAEHLVKQFDADLFAFVPVDAIIGA